MDRSIPRHQGPSRPRDQGGAATWFFMTSGNQGTRGTIITQDPSLMGTASTWEPSTSRDHPDPGAQLPGSLEQMGAKLAKASSRPRVQGPLVSVYLGIKSDEGSRHRAVGATLVIEAAPAAWIPGTKGQQARCRPWRARSLVEPVPCSTWLPWDQGTQLDERPIPTRDPFRRGSRGGKVPAGAWRHRDLGPWVPRANGLPGTWAAWSLGPCGSLVVSTTIHLGIQVSREIGGRGIKEPG